MKLALKMLKDFSNFMIYFFIALLLYIHHWHETFHQTFYRMYTFISILSGIRKIKLSLSLYIDKHHPKPKPNQAKQILGLRLSLK